MDAADQPELPFETGSDPAGYNAWLDQRHQTMRQLARRMGLPLERKVEVWIRGEIRLVGVLRLRDQPLFLPEERDPKLELVVENVPFTAGEILSCVVVD